MKNIIRLSSFFLALFLVTSLSAQTTAPIGSKGGNSTTVNGGGTGTTDATQTYVSSSDNAVINITQGTISYTVYAKRFASSTWQYVQGQANVGGSTNPEKNQVMISVPNSYQIQVVLSVPAGSAATVTFSN